MTHTAIFGQTETGKTWLMKRRAALLVPQGLRCIVHSGTGDPGWPGCMIAYTADQFEAMLNDPANFGAFVFVDEATVLYADVTRRDHPTTYMLGQTGRHKGYQVMFATQFPTGLQHNVRVNCGVVYCFRLGARKYARMVAEDWSFGEGYERAITDLPKLEFYAKRPMQPPELLTLAETTSAELVARTATRTPPPSAPATTAASASARRRRRPAPRS